MHFEKNLPIYTKICVQIFLTEMLNLLTRWYFFLVNNWPSPICGKILKNLSIHTDNSLIWPLAKCAFWSLVCLHVRIPLDLYMSCNESCFQSSFTNFTLWSVFSVILSGVSFQSCLIKIYCSCHPKILSALLFLCPSTADCSNRRHWLS